NLRTENAQLQAAFAHAKEERDRHARDLGAMKREAESTWASERVENALLRERINDVAAEVARMTAVLEGPGSAIDTIFSAPEQAANVNGGAKPAAPANTNGDDKGSLADRIRA